MKRLLLTLFCVVVVSSASAASERVLLPIVATNVVPGANGSMWFSRLAISNQSQRPISVFGYGPCPVGACFPPQLSPKTTIFPTIYQTFLSVDESDLADIAIQLRIQDLSRQAQTWGTTIPTVPERDAYRGRVMNLVDIPLTPAFRAMVRVFDFDPPVIRQVKLRIYAVDPEQTRPTNTDQLLLERTESFAQDSRNPSYNPPTIQLLLSGIPELLGHDRVRVEIEPVSSDLRFWGFVSITNNETQHVTVVTPR